jgi:hypothetical protein
MENTLRHDFSGEREREGGRENTIKVTNLCQRSLDTFKQEKKKKKPAMGKSDKYKKTK